MSERHFGPRMTTESGEPAQRRFLGNPEDVAAYFERQRKLAKKMATSAIGVPTGALLSGGIKAVETLGWGVKHLLRLDFTKDGIQPDKTAEDFFGKGYKWARGDSKS